MAANIIASRKLVEPVEVRLKRPGEDDRTETITELEVHAFKARDLRALDGLADNQSGSMALALAARLTRQPVRVIDELGAADFAWLLTHVEGFLPSGPPTGGTASET